MSENEKSARCRLRRQQRQLAIAGWNNEGGSGQGGRAQSADVPGGAPAESKAPALTNAELVQLQIRVIALENLVIALLAEGSARELERADAMAVHVAPRPGFTPHRQTIHAAAAIERMVARARHFRTLSRRKKRPDV